MSPVPLRYQRGKVLRDVVRPFVGKGTGVAACPGKGLRFAHLARRHYSFEFATVCLWRALVGFDLTRAKKADIKRINGETRISWVEQIKKVYLQDVW